MGTITRLGFDRSSVRSTDADGRLHVAQTNLSKAAVNPYYGREIPNGEALGLDPDKVYRLYRHPDELEKGAASFNNLPLLSTHVGVNADEPRQELVVGSIGSDVRFEAPYLVASMCVWTAEAIARIEAEATRELSCAYRYDASMVPGVTPGGESYDGVMTNIRGNHVALVEEGRAGPDVLVADSKPRSTHMRRSILAAALAPFLATGIDKLAFDKAMDDAEEAEAMDSELTDAEKKAAEDEAIEAKGGKDAKLDDAEKEMAYNKAKDKKARDRKAKDKKARDEGNASEPGSPEGGAKKPSGASDGKTVTRAEAERMAADAAATAEGRAVARINALHIARKAVEPLVGVVAMDSADEVYAFALGKAGVDIKGVHASAYPALLKLALDARAAKTPAAGADRPIAFDSAAVAGINAALPGLRNIRAA